MDSRFLGCRRERARVLNSYKARYNRHKAAEIETPVASDPSESTPVAVASNYAIRGTFTDWGSTDAINFVAGSNTVIEATYELEAGEYEFKIYNIATETWYGNGSSFDDECENWGFRTDRDNGILVATGGTYKFTIDVSDETRLGVTVTKVTNEDPTEATSSTAAETEPASSTAAETEPASSTTAETEPTSSTAAETEPVRVASDYAIRGTFTDWGSTDAIYFVAGSTTVIEAVYEIEAGSHPFKLYNMETSTWYGNGSSFDDECENWGFRSDRDNGILVATGGTYKITVDISDDTRLGVTVTKISDTDPTEPASSTAAETEPASSTAAETEPTSSTAAETEPTTPVVKNVTITFKDGTSSGWIDEAGAKIYLYDEDAKKEYLGTAGTGVWTFEIPETVTNISFYRVQTSFSTTSFWNSWTTAVSKREASFVTFTATENNAGSWNGEGVKMYLRGSFNSWDAGTAMTANADGTYSVDYELAVGNYEYKIATSDWSVGYPAQNATLNVTTAGTYRFVLDGTTVSATLVS